MVVSSRTKHVDAWLLASWVGLGSIIALAFVTCADVGLTWDESVELNYGAHIWNWYASGFADQHALWGLQSRYGGLFDAFAQLIIQFAPMPACETKHLLTLLTGIAGAIATWKIANRLSNTRAAFIAASMLVLTPAWIGHALFNPKDIPFAAGVVWVVYACVSIMLSPAALSWRSTLLAGVSLGAALGVRPAGMFLISYPVFAVLVHASQRRQGFDWRECAKTLSAVLAIAWPLMLSTWPWAQHAPLSRPLRAAAQLMQYAWEGPVLYRGAPVQSGALPRGYLPTWFAITLPEGYFLGLAAALWAVWSVRRSWLQDRPRAWSLAFLTSVSSAPLAAAIITRPVLYDGLRHFLFLLPTLAAVCGIGLSSAFERAPAGLRRFFGLGFALATFCTACDVLALHPYEYAYFNRVSGGLPAAAGRYETDYWGASYKEGLRWVLDHVHGPEGQRVRIASCNDFDELAHYFAQTQHAADAFELTHDRSTADVFLSTTRFNCHHVPGRVLHTVERQGVPLLYVLDTPRPRS